MLKKLRRMLESLFSVEKGRVGSCRGCGACCNLPLRCFFLNDQNRCAIYPLRPPQCRKFPRNRRDISEVRDCGFRFD